ncbi:cell division cycle protein 16 homolog isoform X1 [Daphnia carinata]|uniref:cell division cycle protein 16 homolog isoform X1 n=2 Tax=Daphnia carinata TaxID=120202 RepID=UPI00257BE6D6|nr:cell division cycle protein 16 homolog isoform X1 [Daphnia carinata]
MKVEEMLEKFRSETLSSIEALRFPTALYWAEKAVTASDGSFQDVYMLGKCMFFCKQYHRAAKLITQAHLDEKHLNCKHLAAQCLYEAQMYAEALQLLKNDHMWNDTGLRNQKPQLGDSTSLSQQHSVHSSMYLLRGKVHEAMDNRIPAIEDYKMALKLDVYCSEAFEMLVHHEMLTPEEENDLLEHLPFDEQCTSYEDEAKLLRALYTDQVRKYCKPEERAPSSELMPLRKNLSIRVNHAQRMLNGCDYRGCFNMLQEIMKADPNHQACLPIYITCLVAMKNSQILFTLSHRLVDSEPDNATSWFAVGCYYYVIGRFEESRKYLHKATTLDRNLGAAWLMRGHAFAAENEHDQAMAAYFKASQLMRGSHLPMLYVGLEHGLMSNVRLANSFFNQAHSLAPDDPFVLHELGTVAYQNGDYQLAEKCFLQAVDMVSSMRHTTSSGDSNDFPMDDTWEPLLNNLGHVCRKLKKYEQAIDFHQKALLVSPMRASTFAALGYVYALTLKYDQAIEYFQKALALKRDDTFSTTMLNSVLEAYLNEAPAFLGAPKEIPPPVTNLAETSGNRHVLATPGISKRLMASTSAMEMSNMSMPDISEEDVIQMDTPGYYLDARDDDSVLSGIASLRTPSDALVTPANSGTVGFGFRPGELGRGHMRQAAETIEEDTPDIIQRR